MTNSPDPLIISAGEAAALVEKHGLREKLSTLHQKLTPANQHPQHTANCCTITIVEYYDPEIGTGPVAIEERQRGKFNSDAFTSFWISDQQYIVHPTTNNKVQLEDPTDAESK
jgi:hypothetical protein